ncbi:MAG: tetratricopeptide repeat protein [Deltaproteobacteria bacterium]|nr:tetratricopeptide repeat protein [Deltaproteobacteria bacterium]
MKWSEVAKILNHFGFQLKEQSREDFDQEVKGLSRYCYFGESDGLVWYLKKGSEKAFIELYQNAPAFKANPKQAEDGDHITLSFAFEDPQYDDLLELVDFMQSGLIEAFYIQGVSYVFPQIVRELADPTIQNKNDDFRNDILNRLQGEQGSIKDNAIIQNYMGKLYNDLGQHQKAAQHFVNACEAEPFFGEPYSNMGTLMWATGDKERSFKLFREAIIRNPFDVSMQDNFIKSGIHLGKSEEMKTAIEKIEEYYPDYIDLLFLKALLYQNAGQKEECANALKELIKRNPSDQRAQTMLSEMAQE